MSFVAVPFAVLRSGGSASDVGYVVAAGLVPTVVSLLVGGVVSDPLPRQRVMVAANLAEGAAQPAFAVLGMTGRARIWENGRAHRGWWLRDRLSLPRRTGGTSADRRGRGSSLQRMPPRGWRSTEVRLVAARSAASSSLQPGPAGGWWVTR